MPRAGFLASVATWFLAAWVLGQLGAGGLAVQAATGLLAVIVLLVVMNWFFHKVYWTGWIQNRNKHKRAILSRDGVDRRRATTWGLIALGLTSVYREGFEVVLFLQNLRLSYGARDGARGRRPRPCADRPGRRRHLLRPPPPALQADAGADRGDAGGGPDRDGRRVGAGDAAGGLAAGNGGGAPVPGWVGLWFAVFPTVEGLVAQALAVALVLGSYFGAEYWRVKRPRRGAEPAPQRSIRAETTAS